VRMPLITGSPEALRAVAKGAIRMPNIPKATYSDVAEFRKRLAMNSNALGLDWDF
jgi:hypothetical protein